MDRLSFLLKRTAKSFLTRGNQSSNVERLVIHMKKIMKTLILLYVLLTYSSLCTADNSMYLIALEVGDSGGDGHGKTEKFLIRSNFDTEKLGKAENIGEKKIKIKFAGVVVEEYGDTQLPRKTYNALKKAGIRIPEEELEITRDFVSLNPEAYLLIWLGIAGVGDPTLRYERVEPMRSLGIGGYGLFD